jgi:hypothetical protein
MIQSRSVAGAWLAWPVHGLTDARCSRLCCSQTFVVEGKQCEWVVRTRVMSDCGGEHGSGGLVSWCSDDGVDDVYEIDVPSALVNSAASPLHLRVLLYDQDLGADDFIGSKSFELAPPPAGGEVAVNWTPVTHGTLAHIMSKVA